MEKIIKISGKDVALRANARNLTIYRDEFQEDYFLASGMIQNMYIPMVDADGNQIKRKGKLLYTVDATKLDSIRLARLIWTMAKTADKELIGFEDWLDSLEAFPILEVFQNAADLISVNLATTTEIKNADAAES